MRVIMDNQTQATPPCLGAPSGKDAPHVDDMAMGSTSHLGTWRESHVVQSGKPEENKAHIAPSQTPAAMSEDRLERPVL